MRVSRVFSIRWLLGPPSLGRVGLGLQIRRRRGRLDRSGCWGTSKRVGCTGTGGRCGWGGRGGMTTRGRRKARAGGGEADRLGRVYRDHRSWYRGCSGGRGDRCGFRSLLLQHCGDTLQSSDLAPRGHRGEFRVESIAVEQGKEAVLCQALGQGLRSVGVTDLRCELVECVVEESHGVSLCGVRHAAGGVADQYREEARRGVPPVTLRVEERTRVASLYSSMLMRPAFRSQE